MVFVAIETALMAPTKERHLFFTLLAKGHLVYSARMSIDLPVKATR